MVCLCKYETGKAKINLRHSKNFRRVCRHMADPRSVGRIIYGIAVLRYDDRSTGRSGGEYQGASIPEFATDAESAIAYLRSRQEILPDKVGAIGHSEGGFVAFQVAAHKKADFIITLAGGGMDGRELLLMQRAALLETSGAPENFIRYYNNYMRQVQE